MNLSNQTLQPLTRLLAKVNFNSSAVQLVSYSFSKDQLVIYLGTDETENIKEATRVILSPEEASAILQRSGTHDDFSWFNKTSAFNRLEALTFIKAYLLKLIRIPHLKVA